MVLLSANLQKLLLPPINCRLCPVKRRRLLRLNLLRGIENPGLSLSFSHRGKPGTYIAFNLGHLTMTKAASVTHSDGPGNGRGGGCPDGSGQHHTVSKTGARGRHTRPAGLGIRGIIYWS